MATMNVSLPDALKSFVEERAASGEYAGASDYVRDLVRRDAERRAAITALQRLIDEAEASGPDKIYDRNSLFKAITGKKPADAVRA